MPNNQADAPRALPDRPNLRHLKDQAKDLLKAGQAESLADAQFKIACLYGFASWPKLKAHVESLEETGKLKRAIDTNDFDTVKAMMTRNPALHRAPLGYGKDGPLTWVAECRVPWEPPSPVRLAMAEWMIENGSDVHQGGDGPLMRATLNSDRIPMAELLVRHGADVNARWHGWFPMIWGPCESLDPDILKWLLEHGADANAQNGADTALDYAIATYVRSPEELTACINVLLAAGAVTRYDVPGVLAILRGRLDELRDVVDRDATLLERRFPELTFGTTGERNMTLAGATLLHVAAEYGSVESAQLLLDRGADVNVRADVNDDGVGGQTPIFHAVSQQDDFGFDVARLLIERGADLALRPKLPGYYERPGEVVECTPLGYALRFPGNIGGTVALLRERGAPE